MVEIINQLSGSNADQFRLKLNSSTKQLARGKARAWARKNFPSALPTDINIESIKKVGTANTRIAEFIPNSVTRNKYEITVGVRK